MLKNFLISSVNGFEVQSDQDDYYRFLGVSEHALYEFHGSSCSKY